MLWPVVKALLGHYRRYPFQIILVWLGLTLGVSLLVGVSSINSHARQSYEHGEKLFSNPLPYRIRPKHAANKIPQGFYIQLRRDGFHQCAPFESLRIRTANGTDLMLVGIDPVAMIEFESGSLLDDISSLALMKPPYPVLVSADLALHMKWNNGDFIRLNDGSALGPISIDTERRLNGTRIVADMSLLRMIERSSGISVIACADMPEEKIAKLKSVLPNGMVLTRSSRAELESLTEAFHLNLSAMGMLAFLVGLFIFYQAMSMTLTQRQPLVGNLRQMGVSGWQLAQALLLELFALVFVGWLCGNILGMLLANQLIPTVSASLGDLYDTNIGLSIAWDWRSSLYSFYLSLAGAIVACAWPLVRLLRSQPSRLTTRLSLVRFAGAEFTIQALIACACCVAAIALYQAPQTQETGFAIIALMLLSVALFTPYIIWKVFESLSYTLRWVKVRWFFADAAASMSYRGVATMAFMLAMAANIGVETMVGSFRDTTDKWLTQRLAADLYIYPNNSAAARMSTWLTKQPEVDSVWWRWEKDISTDKGALQVVSTGASEGELDALTVKLGIPNYWYHLHHSKGVMISESMALKLGIRPGDYIDLTGKLGSGWQVVGVYYDYGNPYNQVLLSHRNWLYAFAGSGSVALGAVLNDGVNPIGLKRRLETIFRLDAERIFDNSHIHSQAMRVFDRTFSIADTLGNITLVIAVFGIFFATVAGEVSRQKHISLLRCLGMSGRELILMGSLQLFVFGAIAILIAMPLGLALANLVVDIVIKQSFGWTLEVQFIPTEYLHSGALAMLSLMVAGAIPVLRMVRNTPMKSLRDSL
ncbi:ABC transporter permease [Vibrio tubiashii]|jgi:putative ABC transport system permease protein|uniref:ABC transporter permease n=1 Tax=Vibrio tubiashii ATCC 19109 TaxID=1051646 RepID=F9TDB1_9VIBR|nr:ABC transporter permease [Vibrio tubiashii]AIW14227.1 ABC transporter permease [Vibrio tubiashii ATCC 19109]EGU46970.1 ABC transporter permease [Vibrio tubiashii ATCC 19109]EIF03786.1 membrane protein [Vibrio tubiashii NCIMB 1337 = ATCC 19106]MCG9578833.1 ABC transporter permease [Vibrio tubiashii]